MLFLRFLILGFAHACDDIGNVDSILETPLQRLEARHPSVVHSGLASLDSGYDQGGVGTRALARRWTWSWRPTGCFHRRPAAHKLVEHESV